jgi:hypothetical protein
MAVASDLPTSLAIARARRAAAADRYAANAFSTEWRTLPDLRTIANELRELADRALEPNIFYEADFVLEAANVFGRDAGAVLVWSGTSPRKLLGFFPARIETQRYGLSLPVLVGWTHPYAPLGTPLVEREAAEQVIAAWLAHISGDPDLPGVLLMPFVQPSSPFAAELHTILRRGGIPSADLNIRQRAMLAPRGDRLMYVERTLGAHRQGKMRRVVRGLGEAGALLFTTGTEPDAVVQAVDDFCEIEARGWKGDAGSAVLHHEDIRRFMRNAMRGLAERGKASVSRILIDGHPIAAGIVLRSGDTAWFWKIAYDEAYERYSPGVVLTLAITENLVEDATLLRTDSCAIPNHPMIDHIWRERLGLCDRLIGVRSNAAFASVRRLERLRGAAITVAKSIRERFHR